MKKIFDKLKKSILFYAIMFLLAFIIGFFLLGIINITYRQWVYYAVILIFVIGVIAGIVQIIRGKNKKAKKVAIVISVISVIFAILFWPVIYFVVVFPYCPEHVVTKNGKKYVAYVNSFLKVNVYYYDYINGFLVGSQKRIREYYGKGGYDPFDGKHDKQEPKEINYYDE